LAIRLFGFSLISNRSFHQLLVQSINDMPHQTNQLMPRSHCLTCLVQIVCAM
jgi:hypothetical protein